MPLLSLGDDTGHGKVWRRVLDALDQQATLVPVSGTGRPARRWQRRGVDVVLADGHGELPLTELPVVAEIHEAGWFEPRLRALLPGAFLQGMEARTAAAVQRAEAVITLSAAARRDLVASYGIDPGRVHAVHLGVDPIFSAAAPGGAELVARALGGRRAPYVLYAAVLHPRKNLVALREAMSRLARQGWPHVLAVAGRPAADGSDAAALQREALAELPGAPGRVAALGQPSDAELAALMAGAAAFCLPSLYEGFGLTVLEAMACGTPVVVSDRGALPEVVGEAGVIVTPEPDALAAALARVLGDEDEAVRLGRAGRHRAGAFTWERTASGWLEVLSGVAEAAYTAPR